MGNTVISSISFTIFCYDAVCDFNYMLWDSQAIAMRFVWNAIKNWNGGLNNMAC